MNVTKRAVCKAAAALALAAGSIKPLKLMAQTTSMTALKDAAAQRGIRYGSNSDAHFIDTPAEYRLLFTHQCALYAPVIWAPSVNPKPGEFNFTSCQPDLDFATSYQLKFTGAHLYWYLHSPGWFDDIPNAHGTERAIANYAQRVSARYAGRAYSWNVVNEAIKPEDGNLYGLRKCWAMRMLGPSYIDLAFQAARLGDPKALLVYNDSDFELDTRAQEDRRTALLRMLDMLQTQNTPIGGIGLQSHLQWRSFSAFNERRYRAFLREIAARKLKILITELDVLDVGLPSDLAERDRKVADVYARFLMTALDETAVSAVVTWGLSDRYSWLTPSFDAKFARSDGKPVRPVPFDDNFKPTAAYSAMMKAFREAPNRAFI